MNSIALEQYEKAVRLSREGGFNPINALAHELAGRFSLACGYPTASDAHFRGAIAAWGRAGAQAKVRQLEQDFPHLLASGQSRAYDTAAFAQNEVIRDLQSVIKASRALSEEINLERLIENLMTLLLERAGAQRGLLLRVSDNHIPEIEASAWTSTDGVRVRILKASPMATDMPLSVLAAVIRTGQEIRTGKPEEFHPFSQDPYLVTSGAAVMCVPMFKQARLVGVLYLENRLMPEVFTAEHSRVVSLLGAQAAVSLETARLYAELLEENIQRRRVEKELRASQTSLMLGEQISHTGSWRWELVQDLMFMSEEYARILGLPEQQKMISMAEFLTFVHEDDYGRISTLVNQSVRDGLSMRAEFRIIRTDGSVRYILGIGDPVGVGSEVNEYYRHHQPASGRGCDAGGAGGSGASLTSHYRRATDLLDRARDQSAADVDCLERRREPALAQPRSGAAGQGARGAGGDRRRGRASRGDHPQHSVSDAQTGPHVYANRSALPDPPHHYAFPQRT